MCKGDGGRVLSNVELILPWNVVEACYTLERNDSTCFFAANDAEGTTSQISLCKLEDHSVKIQVTVTALEPDEDDDVEAEAGPSRTDQNKKFTLFGSEEEEQEQPRMTRSGKTPVRHQKKLRPDLDLPEDEYQEGQEEMEDGQQGAKKMKARPRQISQLKPTQMNKSLTAMWRKRKKRARQMAAAAAQQQHRKGNQGFSLKQARSVLGTPEKPGKAGLQQVDPAAARRRSLRGHGGEEGGPEPAMPILEAEEEENQEIDLETIYKYGSQMREFEARKRKEEENWEKVQEELKQGKDSMSMVIVLKPEDDVQGLKKEGGTAKPITPGKAVRKDKKENKVDEPLIHVIEPMLADAHSGPEHWEYADREEEAANEEEQSTQVIYIHRHSKNNPDGEEDLDQGKKFFKRRRDKGTRVAKKDKTKSTKPLWQQQVMKKGLKVEPERPDGPISCRYCPRNFKDHSYLFRHVKGHHMDQTEAEEYLDDIRPKMKVSCPVCDKSISSIANVANHMKQCHPETDTSVQCDMCQKVYKTPASLKQHIRQRHSFMVKKFNCPQCDQVFNERRGLTDHVNCVHETTQVYTCNKCWKVFLTKSRLRRHTYIHGEHRHICKDCGKGFHIKDNMNKHIRIVHEKNHGKMWKCSYCSKEFLVKGNMTQHIRGIHLKQFPFTCSKCLQGFRRMRDMMVHMEKCNEEENVSVEMFGKQKVKEEGKEPKKTRGQARQSTDGEGTPGPKTPNRGGRRKSKPSSKEVVDDDDEAAVLNEYVIQDQMVVSADEDDDDDDEDEYDDEEGLEDSIVEAAMEHEEEREETQEVIINSNFTADPNDPMKLHIEQDGVVIPIEVVIGQNEGGDNEGFEVIADGAAAT